jgi:sigma-B regulation protein RsbU (phosphoserine phosphatase)
VRPESGRTTCSAAGEDDAQDLYDNAPCGYLSTRLDGQIVKINDTLLRWLGFAREDLVGRLRFADLLTVGGKMYYETHFAPMLRLHGELGGIALELVRADRVRLPVLVTSTIKTAEDGAPVLIRTAVLDASDRRAYERELLRARQDADRERDRVQLLATTLQRSLLPPVLPDVPGLDAVAHYHHASADDVGGDFYDLFPLSQDRWGFFLGDVCGKGAPAAAVTSLTRYTLRATAVHTSDPVAVLRTLNTVLLEDHADDPTFCTVLFGLLTPVPGGYDIVLASGGHPPALLLRADGSVEYQHTHGGMLVGALPRARFTAIPVRLRAGDTLLLYTDGLTEARTGNVRDRYEEEALVEFATGLAPATAAEVISATTELLARFGTGLDDDAAMLALGVPR